MAALFVNKQTLGPLLAVAAASVCVCLRVVAINRRGVVSHGSEFDKVDNGSDKS